MSSEFELEDESGSSVLPVSRQPIPRTTSHESAEELQARLRKERNQSSHRDQDAEF
jgi:hypothetical protein